MRKTKEFFLEFVGILFLAVGILYAPDAFRAWRGRMVAGQKLPPEPKRRAERNLGYIKKHVR